MKFFNKMGLGIMLVIMFLTELISSGLIVGQVTSSTVVMMVTCFGVGLGMYVFGAALEKQ